MRLATFRLGKSACCAGFCALLTAACDLNDPRVAEILDDSPETCTLETPVTSQDLGRRALVLVEATALRRMPDPGDRAELPIDLVLEDLEDAKLHRIDCHIRIGGRAYAFAALPHGQYQLAGFTFPDLDAAASVHIRPSLSAKSIGISAELQYLGKPYWIVDVAESRVEMFALDDTAHAREVAGLIAPDLASKIVLRPLGK